MQITACQLTRTALAVVSVSAISFPAFLYQPVFAIRAQHSGPTLEDLHAAEAQPDGLVTVRTRSDISAVISPNASAWENVPAAKITLFPQSVSAPHGGGSVADMSVKVLHLEEGMAFRLEWSDTTCDNGRKGSKFPDAVAIEFPVDESGDTRLAMGHSGGPVNILYWTADVSKPKKGKMRRQAEELLASGIYNRMPKPDKLQLLQSDFSWRNHRWCVVLFKPFNDADQSSPKFESGKQIPVAFAVWNGSSGERLGMKSVSNWNVLNCK